jgi:hypothetical protein
MHFSSSASFYAIYRFETSSEAKLQSGHVIHGFPGKQLKSRMQFDQVVQMKKQCVKIVTCLPTTLQA